MVPPASLTTCRPIARPWDKKPVFSKSGVAKNGPLRSICSRRSQARQTPRCDSKSWASGNGRSPARYAQAQIASGLTASRKVPCGHRRLWCRTSAAFCAVCTIAVGRNAAAAAVHGQTACDQARPISEWSCNTRKLNACPGLSGRLPTRCPKLTPHALGTFHPIELGAHH